MKKISTTASIMLLTIGSLNGFAGDALSSSKAAHQFDTDSPQLIQTFKAVQNICGLTTQFAAAHEVELQPVSGSRQPGFFCRHTKQGLFLFMKSYPEILVTPWGEVRLAAFWTISSRGRHEFTTEIFKHLSLVLVRINGSAKKILYCINDDDSTRKITDDELQTYIGTDEKIIVEPCGCYSMYKIKAIDGIPLPEPIEHSHGGYTHRGDSDKHWEKMIKQHQSSIGDKDHSI